ncbi:sensor histidine kinase [Zavarzinia sp. CC-PAN008]|uniref:sensor histidine kinase n=1 Tax=Zavarzinia sp. CC-PAN008 TaxID=3243332 RepID=UPI003F742539
MADGQPASDHGGSLQAELDRVRAELAEARTALAAREQALNLALGVGAIAIWDIDLSSGQVRSSSDLGRFGIDSSQPFDVKVLWRLLHPDDLQAFRARLGQLLAGVDVGVPYEWRVIRPDGGTEWLSTRSDVIRDAQGQAVRLLAVSADVTALKEAQGRVADINDRLILALDAAQMTVWEQDILTGVIRTFRPEEAVPGRSRRELHEVTSDRVEDVYASIHPDDVRRLRAMTPSDIDEQGRFGVEFRLRTPDGGEIIQQARGQVRRTGRDHNVRLIGVTTDVTEDRRVKRELETALRHREMLLKEVNHRIKNSLQLISSLLSLQAQGVADAGARTLFEEALLRVRAVGMLHQRLYQTENVEELSLAPYLAELAHNVAEAVTGTETGIVLAVDTPEFSASPDTAISLALMLNELLVNAIKHAYPDGEGQVRVLGRIDGDTYCLRVEDDGVGLSGGATRRGLGSRMINALIRQLGGEVLNEAQSRGHAVELRVPTERLAPVQRG